MSRLFVPAGVERVVPEYFSRALKHLDPNLIVYFNPHRDRWIIDRCTRDGVHRSEAHAHTASCPRTNVRVVQDAEGGYMPLCDAVLDDLRASDTWSKYGSVEQYATETDNAAAAMRAEQQRKVDALYHETTKDHRAQLAKAWTLIQRHDTARVNQ